MDRQETYDKVRDHLMNQGAESFCSDMCSCAYRGVGGKMCAIGALLPDDLYSREFEGKDVKGLPEDIKRAIGCDNAEDVEFLSGLQRIHDKMHVELWAESLYDFAIENGLRP